jgi:ATP-binding cassette subfamily B protein
MKPDRIFGFPFYPQLDAKDCGPACLRMIAAWHGKQVSQFELSEAAAVDRDGVSLFGIAKAAEETGFACASLRVGIEELKELPLPAILHWHSNHFVVLYKIRRNHFFIADPAIGKMKVNEETFLKNWTTADKKGVAFIAEPAAEFYNTKEIARENNTATFLKKYLGKHKKKIVQLIGCLLLASLFQFLFPYVTQAIVDTGIRQHDLHLIQLLLLAQFVLFFAQAFTEFIRARILLFISTHINLSILTDFWKKLMRLPASFFESKNVGDILQRINDHRRIETFITGSALYTLFSAVSILVFSVILFNYEPLIFAVFALGSLLYLLWIRIFLKKKRILDYDRFAASARESSATMQLINGMQEIKLNNAERQKRKEWQSMQATLFKLNYRSLSLNQFQQAGAFFLNQGKNILIIYLSAVAVLHGDLTLGQMLAIQFITGQLNGPIEQLIQFIQQAQEARISLERLNEVHRMEDEESQSKTYAHTLPSQPDIRIANLRFTYPGKENAPALRGINLVIPAKKVTALVGMSGSGKSTLLKLLLRFYEKYRGKIWVGNEDLHRISPSYWRSKCGAVLQDGYIFNDSIARNIALSDRIPDEERILHACRLAAIDEFVNDLPYGIQTRIGGQGQGLSGGQKQRLMIARAIYKDPEFLFFDEATNALDANNEKLIMDNMLRFFRGRTVVVAAHRLSTIMHADNIVVLQDGRIAEQGRHEDLLNQHGKYYELVNNQLAEFSDSNSPSNR